jgi:actin-related protein
MAAMELECTMDEQDVIVLDNGSGYLKAGFSGEDAPRVILPTVTVSTTDDVREDGHGSAETHAKKPASYFGDKALEKVMLENASVAYPIQRGKIMLDSNQKEALEDLWDHTLRTGLEVEPEDLPMLIADPLPLGQKAYPARQWIAEVMFEKHKVKSLAIMNSSVLSLFSTGRTRGLVVESGEGITQAVPVFEGYAIPHAIFTMEKAGKDITERVMQMMNAHQDARAFSSSPKVMRALKEKVCSVAASHSQAVRGRDYGNSDAERESRSFELPDGKIIEVEQTIRMGAPEILFGGGEQGEDASSMQKICKEAIDTCDLDFRQDLVRSLVVAGGTSMLPGLAPRLKTELSGLLSASSPELARQVDICVDSQRRYAAWIGGSMFASLSTFDQVAISRSEFDDGKADTRGLVARKTW